MFPVQPVVEVVNHLGVVQRAQPYFVTLTLIRNQTESGKLGGNIVVQTYNGMSSFAGLNIQVSGGGYRLVAMSPGISEALSRDFTVLPDDAFQLIIKQNTPTFAVAGERFTPPPSVEVMPAIIESVTGNGSGNNCGKGKCNGNSTVTVKVTVAGTGM